MKKFILIVLVASQALCGMNGREEKDKTHCSTNIDLNKKCNCTRGPGFKCGIKEICADPACKKPILRDCDHSSVFCKRCSKKCDHKKQNCC